VSHALCCRAVHDDCMCPECDVFGWETRHPPRDPDDGAAPLAGAIDGFFALLPARVERRRWAVRAVAAIRERGVRALVTAGALRVPMEELPPALVAWLAVPENRAAVEDVIDEEGGDGLRLYDAGSQPESKIEVPARSREKFRTGTVG